jgi:hypothetical protein
MPTCCSLPLWAAQVAAATPLPDRRLNTRLERLLPLLAQKPLDAFPQAAPDWHQAKAIYRFLANERFAWQDLLAGWQAITTRSVRGQPLVYVAHDTTTVSYSTLKQTTGLGYINQIEAARGLHCHSSIVLRADGAMPSDAPVHQRAKATLPGRMISQDCSRSWRLADAWR